MQMFTKVNVGLETKIYGCGVLSNERTIRSAAGTKIPLPTASILFSLLT